MNSEERRKLRESLLPGMVSCGCGSCRERLAKIDIVQIETVKMVLVEIQKFDEQWRSKYGAPYHFYYRDLTEKLAELKKQIGS